MRARIAMCTAGALLLANVIVPLVLGDFYPFTSAPMFREAPTECSVYRVFDHSGRELPAENWLLQRVYDGNPVGYGVGARPPQVLEQVFGVVHSEAEVREHLRYRAKDVSTTSAGLVIVEQSVLGPIDSSHVGVVRTNRWMVPLVESLE